MKIDSCGIQRNMSHFAYLFNLSGKAVMLEDCHNGNPYHPIRKAGDRVDCPMNFFRTSGDIRPQVSQTRPQMSVHRSCAQPGADRGDSSAVGIDPL